MAKMKDLALDLMNYEEGQLTDDEVLELFAYLIANELVFTVPAHIRIEAAGFIENGYISPDGQIIDQF